MQKKVENGEQVNIPTSPRKYAEFVGKLIDAASPRKKIALNRIGKLF